MKDIVDLTENRDFRQSVKSINNPGSSISYSLIDATLSIGFHQTTSRFNILKEDYYISNDTGYILQGNQYDRNEKRFSNEFSRGNYCDCCGKPLKPYYNNSLCNNCNDRDVFTRES